MSKSICKPNVDWLSEPSWLRYYFPLLKTNGCHIKILPIVWPYYCQRYVILHQLPNFIQIAPPLLELLSHIDLSRWRSQHRNSTSDFGFCEVSFKKIEIYLPIKFRWDITTSGFWKQTAAILKYDFRFPYSPLHRHRCTLQGSCFICGRLKTSLHFQDGGRQPCWVCSVVMVDLPQSAVECLDL